MTQTEHTPASPKAPLAPDVDALDGRSRRAWMEHMAVRPLEDGRYAVDSQSGATYVVDLPRSDCTCPDSELRGALCKHIRRVAIEISRGAVPAPDRTVRCRACNQPTTIHDREERPFLCDRCRLEPGDLVFDRERGGDTPLLVIAVTDQRADEVEIPELDRTVAEYGVNRDYPSSDPVVEVVYPRSIRPTDAPERYAFPISRLVKRDDTSEQTTLPAFPERN